MREAIFNALQRFPGLAAAGGWQLTHLQENAYRLSGAAGTYFVKWVAQDDACGQNEIRVNREVLARSSLPAPRLLHVLEGDDGGRAAIWEWLEGTDLRHASRRLLPQAFAALGRFHQEQRGPGEVVSSITQRAYPTPGDLLQADVQVLCAGLGEPLCRRCTGLPDVLEGAGFATLIHGDMHPGNLRIAGGGLLFVDWGFARRSLNLFDLDYVHSIELGGEREWWDITPAEAQDVVPAYFQAAGLDMAGMWDIHRAVMAWNQLHSRYNALYHGNHTAAGRCLENLERLLQ